MLAFMFIGIAAFGVGIAAVILRVGIQIFVAAFSATAWMPGVVSVIRRVVRNQRIALIIHSVGLFLLMGAPVADVAAETV